jgi:formate dehydrogenase accessory protein FdhE
LTDPGPYAQRQDRAAQLLAAHPHAAEVLGLYREVLARQEPLYQRALAGGWPAYAPPGPPDPPALGIDRLELGALIEPFRSLTEEVAGTAPKPLAAAGSALAGAADGDLRELLRRTVAQDALGTLAASLGAEVAQLAFYARALLEPIAEALAARTPAPEEAGGSGAHGTCRRCGWPPQVAVLRDEPEIKGRRYLVCALCATWWIFPRTTCPSCGEADPAKLPLHASESLPHLRVEECATCKGYIKSVDLRRDGHAVPVVDDVASVELDLWSEERGLWKISRNLLGL